MLGHRAPHFISILYVFFFFFMQRDQNERSASDRTGQDQVKVAVERSKLVTEVKPVS